MVDKTNSILKDISLCKRCCLRIINAEVRQFELYNEILPLEIDVSGLVTEDQCPNCFGLVSGLLTLTDKLLKRLDMLEFTSFLIGTRLTHQYKEIDKILDDKGVPYYLIKQEVIRVFSEIIEDRFEAELRHDFPEVSIILEMKKQARYELEIRSVYILGKYRKYERGIPQTKWPCTYCKGRKCEKCNFTGQQYPKSVEMLVAKPFLDASQSIGSSFHGAGREDIDALMLGEGRPFVLELKQPRIRTLNLAMLQDEVNKNPEVNIHLLQYCSKDTVEDIKKESQYSHKTYRALVETEKPMTSSDLEKLTSISYPIQIKQRTPQRVSHRRADLVREKTIYGVEVAKSESNNLELIIKAQGGAYIKEFISGDDGRSIPSISEVLGQTARCIELDVREVDDKGLFQ